MGLVRGKPLIAPVRRPASGLIYGLGRLPSICGLALLAPGRSARPLYPTSARQALQQRPKPRTYTPDLIFVQGSETLKHAPTLRSQCHMHLPAVCSRRMSDHQMLACQSVDQSHRTVVFDLKSFGQLGYGKPFATGETPYCQKSLMLLGCQPNLANHAFAEPKKLPQAVTKGRQHLVLSFRNRTAPALVFHRHIFPHSASWADKTRVACAYPYQSHL